jgi:hypothetical protein
MPKKNPFFLGFEVVLTSISWIFFARDLLSSAVVKSAGIPFTRSNPFH